MYPEDGIQTNDGTKFVICDDCRQAYLAPAYYTFPPQDCFEHITAVFTEPHQGCTGNICPVCADGLVSDDPFDPRGEQP